MLEEEPRDARVALSGGPDQRRVLIDIRCQRDVRVDAAAKKVLDDLEPAPACRLVQSVARLQPLPVLGNDLLPRGVPRITRADGQHPAAVLGAAGNVEAGVRLLPAVLRAV